METLKLTALIGLEISDIRFHYIPENEYGLQSFYAYIKLINGMVITIPKFSDDDNFIQLTEDNLSYLNKRFNTGAFINDSTRAYFIGQGIADFYFSYFNGEVDFDSSAFIKLTNGYYLSENNSGPVGVTNIDLLILDEKEFTKEVKRLNEFNVEVRSFLETKNANASTKQISA